VPTSIGIVFIMTCFTCGADPCINPGFCAICRDADRRKAKGHVLIVERYNEAPEATFNAVVYELRTHGASQLSKPNCQRRLADLSLAQFKSLMASLQQRRGQYPNISDELLTALVEIYHARIVTDAQH
jgi:hypothetical protein